jgi:hypothetical protein
MTESAARGAKRQRLEAEHDELLPSVRREEVRLTCHLRPEKALPDCGGCGPHCSRILLCVNAQVHEDTLADALAEYVERIDADMVSSFPYMHCSPALPYPA